MPEELNKQPESTQKPPSTEAEKKGNFEVAPSGTEQINEQPDFPRQIENSGVDESKQEPGSTEEAAQQDTNETDEGPISGGQGVQEIKNVIKTRGGPWAVEHMLRKIRGRIAS